MNNAINNENDNIINHHYNDIVNNLENDNFVNHRFNDFRNGNLNNDNFYDDIAQHIRNQVLNINNNINNNNLYNILYNHFNNRLNNIRNNENNYIDYNPMSINDINENDLQIDDDIDDDIIDAILYNDAPDDNISDPGAAHEDNVGAAASNHDIDLIVQDRVESIEVPPCRICMENRSVICFVPCGHVCACSSCSQRIDECPLCRTPITRRQGLYFA